jgi:hypothetical protein
MPAEAQQRQPQASTPTVTLSSLTAQGFEIKAATTLNDFALVFLQA